MEFKYEGNSLRKLLEEMGATESQMKAGVVDIMEDALTDHEVSTSATAKRMMQDIEKRMKLVSARVNDFEQIHKDARSDMSAFRKEVRAANVSLDEQVIHDTAVIDGLISYKKVLESTKEVLGDEAMENEAIACKAIEAASYGMWRSVMGPKFDDRKGRTAL